MRHTAKTLSSRITLAIAFLSALVIGLFSVFAGFGAQRLDESERAKEMELIWQGHNYIITSVSQNKASCGTWDEAVIRIIAHDEGWIAKNFGGWMHYFVGYDCSHILDAQNNLIFSTCDGEVIRPAIFWEEQAAGEIVRMLRECLADRLEDGKTEEIGGLDVSISDIPLIDGQPTIVSSRPILPHTNRIMVAATRGYIFLVVKYLHGQQLVKEITRKFRVFDLRYEALESFTFESPGVEVGPKGGPMIGNLAWMPDRPGLRLIKEVAPWAGLALVIAVGVGFYHARSLLRSSLDLQASEIRARHLAFHDMLTGLPNRALLKERLNDAIRKVENGFCEVAIFFVDLDRLRNINGTLGRRVGDIVLQHTAVRLAEVVGEVGIVARVGGDVFAVLIEVANAIEEVKGLSHRVLCALAVPIHLDEDTVYVSASIGLAIARSAETEPEELLRRADIALYEAKRQGSGGIQIFSEEMDDIQKWRRLVETDLRKALVTGVELRLAYQPVYSATGQLMGAEALLRWKHPMHESLSPMVLVSIAEECGLIMQLGDWILAEACRLALRVPIPWIAINVSPVQFREINFSQRCLDIIAQHNLTPDRIQIEITEDVFIDNPETTNKTLQSLKQVGVRVALDDFGIGYSSIGHLQDCPLDRLKIDRLFVQALSDGEQGNTIVAGMIEMAHALKLKITAEGIETAEQWKVLRRMGCDEMQGYYFSRPVDGDVLAKHFFPA